MTDEQLVRWARMDRAELLVELRSMVLLLDAAHRDRDHLRDLFDEPLRHVAPRLRGFIADDPCAGIMSIGVTFDAPRYVRQVSNLEIGAARVDVVAHCFREAAERVLAKHGMDFWTHANRQLVEARR